MLIGCLGTYGLLHMTMAAGIIPNEKQSQRHQIGRSCVVSKYIGETEKRLKKIFLKAWPNNLILFFDEADFVFGKRSRLNDALDRYVSYEKRPVAQNAFEIRRATG
jgi:SpoVK/Ycf46/Vps4 family AAA+-type ATPase